MLSEVLGLADDFLEVLKVFPLEEEIIPGNYFPLSIVQPLYLPSFFIFEIVNNAALFPFEASIQILPTAVSNHEILFHFVLLN